MFLIPESWYVVRRSPTGRGVFARRQLPAGTVLGDYLGRIESREKATASSLYTMMLRRDRFVEPDPDEPGVHLVNHSCEPNAGIYPHRGHVLVVCTRRVFPGEELRFDYWCSPPGDEPWPVCRCGSELCRSTFVLPPDKDERTIQLFLGPRWAGARIRLTVGEMLKPLPRYPRRASDLGVYDVFGSPKAPPLDDPSRELPPRRTLRARIRESGRRIRYPR